MNILGSTGMPRGVTKQLRFGIDRHSQRAVPELPKLPGTEALLSAVLGLKAGSGDQEVVGSDKFRKIPHQPAAGKADK